MAKLRDGVVKRGKTWSYVIRVTDPETGQSKPKWVGGFETEAQAKAARDEARVRARRGEYIDRNRMTVKQYVVDWVDGHVASVKPKTMEGFREDINRYVIPHIGAMRLQSLRPATISKLYRDLLESGGARGGPLSVTTVRHVHRTLRKALNDAVHVDRLTPNNPANQAKLPRDQQAEPGRIWTPEHLRLFLGFAEGHRLYAFYRLAAYTGARRGELLALHRRDVDLDAAEIVIRGSADVIAGERVEGTTKGGRSRVVSVDAQTVAVLREHRKQQAAGRLALGPVWLGERDLVFTRESGEPLYPDTVSNLMTKLIRQYNEPAVPGHRGRPREQLPRPATRLPMARLHDLRHPHATTLLLSGEAVHVVANRLGHADAAITLRVYAHVIRQHAAGLADVFARAVEQEQPGKQDDPGTPPRMGARP